MKKSLHILFMLDFFSFFGGTEYINYNLLAGLKELGHDRCLREYEKVFLELAGSGGE